MGDHGAHHGRIIDGQDTFKEHQLHDNPKHPNVGQRVMYGWTSWAAPRSGPALCGRAAWPVRCVADVDARPCSVQKLRPRASHQPHNQFLAWRVLLMVDPVRGM
jgi:hypothetical protein